MQDMLLNLLGIILEMSLFSWLENYTTQWENGNHFHVMMVISLLGA